MPLSIVVEKDPQIILTIAIALWMKQNDNGGKCLFSLISNLSLVLTEQGVGALVSIFIEKFCCEAHTLLSSFFCDIGEIKTCLAFRHGRKSLRYVSIPARHVYAFYEVHERLILTF